MMKQGRYRALRNLPVGWVTQILHSTDRSERWIRVTTEVILTAGLTLVLARLRVVDGPATAIAVSFVLVHTASWLLIGNFWVYMLDSFDWVRNPGIRGVLDYVDFCRRVFLKSDSCDAILIYGSMCRGRFHGRSDLDLRILRHKGLRNALKAVYAAMYVKTVAFFKLVPVDLQVVDSMTFLHRQMRDDELPIVVYERRDVTTQNPGIPYADVVADPSIVLRQTP